MKKYNGEVIQEAVAMDDARAGFPGRGCYQDVRLAAGEWLKKKGLYGGSMRDQMRREFQRKKKI